jgi:hypothetical protein
VAREWEIEFEEAEPGEVFVRADLARFGEVTAGVFLIRRSGVHYRRTGMRVDPIAATARSPYADHPSIADINRCLERIRDPAHPMSEFTSAIEALESK